MADAAQKAEDSKTPADVGASHLASAQEIVPALERLTSDVQRTCFLGAFNLEADPNFAIFKQAMATVERRVISIVHAICINPTADKPALFTQITGEKCDPLNQFFLLQIARAAFLRATGMGSCGNQAAETFLLAMQRREQFGFYKPQLILVRPTDGSSDMGGNYNAPLPRDLNKLMLRIMQEPTFHMFVKFERDPKDYYHVDTWVTAIAYEETEPKYMALYRQAVELGTEDSGVYPPQVQIIHERKFRIALKAMEADISLIPIRADHFNDLQPFISPLLAKMQQLIEEQLSTPEIAQLFNQHLTIQLGNVERSLVVKQSLAYFFRKLPAISCVDSYYPKMCRSLRFIASEKELPLLAPRSHDKIYLPYLLLFLVRTKCLDNELRCGISALVHLLADNLAEKVICTNAAARTELASVTRNLQTNSMATCDALLGLIGNNALLKVNEKVLASGAIFSSLCRSFIPLSSGPVAQVQARLAQLHASIMQARSKTGADSSGAVSINSSNNRGVLPAPVSGKPTTAVDGAAAAGAPTVLSFSAGHIPSPAAIGHHATSDAKGDEPVENLEDAKPNEPTKAKSKTQQYRAT